MLTTNIVSARPAAMRVVHHVQLLQTAHCLQFIDVTDCISQHIVSSGVENGFVNIQSAHTTAAIVVNEHEPLLLEDMKRTLERLSPRCEKYRHDDFTIRTANLTPDERPNGHAHCKALFLRSSETLNIVDGQLQLGRWQRIFFVELDDARERTIYISVMGQVARETTDGPGRGQIRL